jgi:hypothetical protein
MTHPRYRVIIKWSSITIASLFTCAIAAAYLIDEPLRRKMESNLNHALKGYRVQIERLDFHPIGFSLDLENLVIRQDANPEPAIANIPRLTASVDWKAVLFGRVVADFEIEGPKFFINLNQFRKEQEDETPLRERGWQQAVQEIYPLHINHFAITNAELTYIDRGQFRPLNLHGVNLSATNIRNVESDENQYPSPFHLDARVFEKGSIVLDGRADFLAQPHVTFVAELDCEELELDYFQPITQRYHFTIREGVLSTTGRIEYASKKQTIEVPTLHVDGLDADYVHEKPNSPTKELSIKTDRLIKKESDDPTLKVTFNEIIINNGKLGYINKASQPEYRVFISDVAVNVKNLSNQSEDGIAVGALQGKFMGSGFTKASTRFTPRAKSADFDLNLSIEQTDLKQMNDLLRAFGGVDVTSGIFSFYSEIAVRQGAVNGYVKPLFKNVNVYHPAQDKRKNIFQKLYEGILDGLAWILENRPREEVATQTNISGTLSTPETSTLDVVLGLVQNAFFKAILPGFDRSVQQRAESR